MLTVCLFAYVIKVQNLKKRETNPKGWTFSSMQFYHVQALKDSCLHAKSKHWAQCAQWTQLTAPLCSYSEHKVPFCRSTYANIWQIRKHFAVSNTKKLLYAGFYGDTVPFCIPKTGFPYALSHKNPKVKNLHGGFSVRDYLTRSKLNSVQYL